MCEKSLKKRTLTVACFEKKKRQGGEKDKTLTLPFSGSHFQILSVLFRWVSPLAHRVHQSQSHLRHGEPRQTLHARGAGHVGAHPMATAAKGALAPGEERTQLVHCRSMRLSKRSGLEMDVGCHHHHIIVIL